MNVIEVGHTSTHLKSVKALHAANSQTLGFFPEGAFDDYAHRGQILGAIDDKKCIGYLLYRVSRGRATIAHLCIETSHRHTGAGAQLFSALREAVKDLRGIGLRCRRDYEASSFWQKLGFVAQRDLPGRGKVPADLTFWWFDNGHPTLFTDAILDQVKSKLCVAIDANIFYDLNDPNRSGYIESNALRADWLVDTLELCVTDAIRNDINQSQDKQQRADSWELVEQFTVLPCDQAKLLSVAETLKGLFPEDSSARGNSDRWQIARTIAADIPHFITRDEELLELSANVYELFGTTILRPADLIINIDELRREADYAPRRLSGTLSEIRLVQAGQEDFLAENFHAGAHGETKSVFRLRLRSILSDPGSNECYVVFDLNNHPIGLVAYRRNQSNALELPLIRISRSPIAPTLVRCLLFRSLVLAAEERRSIVVITDHPDDDTVADALKEDGFVVNSEQAIRLTVPIADTAKQIAKHLEGLHSQNPTVRQYCSEIAHDLKDLSTSSSFDKASEIERLLWPAKVIDVAIPSFLVPIQPEWAKELFDEKLAAQTLFGAKLELGLSREGVYYKAKTNFRQLKPPARILWYVSDAKRFAGARNLRACSRLDEVMVGKPKDLYRRFKRLGIYNWENVFEVAKKDLDREIMALRFSDTELFKNPIEWNELQSILRSGGCNTQIQSSVRVSAELFAQLYRRATQV
jgi:GNAT superfamily N-acetyltransferase